MTTSKSRRIKIEWIKMTLKAYWTKYPKQSVSKKKLISTFILTNYSTEQTIKEILKNLEYAGEIKVDGDEVFQGKKWNLIV